MFFLVLRKIMNNKWLTACLLSGSILAVAMVSSIPLYTGGILQRMLTKDLEQFQTASGNYPGRYVMQLNAYSYYQGPDRIGVYNWFNNCAETKMATKLGLPLQRVERLGMDYMTFLPANSVDEKPKKVYSELFGITNFGQHVEMVAGRLPAAQPVKGVIEVIASIQAQSTMNILLNQEIELTDETKQLKEPLKIKVVGLYRRPGIADSWWSEPENTYAEAFLMDYDLFRSEIMLKNGAITTGYWYFAVDYSKLTVERLDSFIAALKAQKAYFTRFAGTRWEFPAQEILDRYLIRESQLRLTLWVLQIPVLLMLAFYIFMVSRLIIENDRNEIAVINSRGASGSQIFGSYLMQSVLLSAVSVAAGPLVAMFICRVLGASNGFLEFVSRTALPLRMTWNTLMYAIIAGFFSIVTMMIPAMWASKVTIVEHKRKKAVQWPFWVELISGIILLGASLYGLYQYGLMKITMLVTAAPGMSVPVDPYMFIISTIFVIGAGLLFLSLYPHVIRLISWAGRKIWPPSLHTSLVQVGRSGGRELFLMLFLILTISIGVFNANSARTINQYIVDKVSYRNGADITLQMVWPSNEIIPPPVQGPPTAADLDMQAQAEAQVITYLEPDFNIYSRLDGTSAAARVFLPKDKVNFYNQEYQAKAGKLMAIVPDEFGNAAWSSPNLLPYHINQYLNLLAMSPNAVLVSEDLMKDMALKPGDSINYSWGKQGYVEGVVYAAVRFWPGLNPYEVDSKYFVIANLNYVQAATSIEPYQIWYKRAPGATTRQIYDDIKAKGMKVSWIANNEQDIVARKNDPLLQGTNGAMTLGFVVTLAVSMIGFFIYWILSIQARTLQFGIFRAMGMSASHVMLMLVFEQIMISGVAVFAGIVIGGVMSQLFVPLLGVVYSAAEQVPPFTVVMSRADYIRLYAIIGVMLLASMALLAVLVRRIKAAQAIKLGED